MSKELKPCPFCGHVGISLSEGSTYRWLAYSCDGCGVGGETRVQTLGEGTPEQWQAKAEADAIKEWNTRALPAAAPEGARVPAGWKQAIHYPECWDVAAYPTFEAALSEVFAAFQCQDPRHANCKWPACECCLSPKDCKAFATPADSAKALPADDELSELEDAYWQHGSGPDDSTFRGIEFAREVLRRWGMPAAAEAVAQDGEALEEAMRLAHAAAHAYADATHGRLETDALRDFLAPRLCAAPSPQQQGAELTPFGVVARAMELASLHAADVAMNNTSGRYANDLRDFLTEHFNPPPAEQQGAEPASKMPLALRLRVLADHIKANNGLRDNQSRDHLTLIEAADALESEQQGAEPVADLLKGFADFLHSLPDEDGAQVGPARVRFTGSGNLADVLWASSADTDRWASMYLATLPVKKEPLYRPGQWCDPAMIEHSFAVGPHGFQCKKCGAIWAEVDGRNANGPCIATPQATPSPSEGAAEPSAKQGLSNERIQKIAETLGERVPGQSDYASWGLGYRRDEKGEYTIPHVPAIALAFARAIEAEIEGKR